MSLDSLERRVFVDSTAFAAQMAKLAERGYQTLTLGQYASCLQAGAFPPRSLLLTFDDAYAHVPELITPTLLRHGFTAVMFAPSEHLGGFNTWDRAHPNLAGLRIATPELLKEMVAGPWEVASHGMRHVDLTQLETRERRRQLIAARECLSDVVGRLVLDLAYPHGISDQSVRDDTRAAGYRMAFTAETRHSKDPLQLPRLVITHGDTPLRFRLKTSAWCGGLYQRVPTATRELARVTMEVTSRA